MSAFSDYISGLFSRIKTNPLTLLAGPLNSPAAHALKLDSLADSIFQPGTVESFVKKETASGRTGQQIEQDEWTAQREDTQYQRGVEDVQAAGLNPAMMYGKGAQPAPSSSAAMPASGGSFSNMLELMMLPAQLENMRTQSQLNKAAAAEKESTVSLNEQLRAFNDRVNPLRERAMELQNNLTSAEEKKIYAQLSEIQAHIEKMSKEAATEEERKNLVIAQKFAEDAKAWQIYQLVPFQIELTQAQSSAAKAAAALSAVNVAYQNKLLKSDYLDNMFSEMSAKARSADARSQMDAIKASIRNGTFGVQELGDNVIANTIEAIQSFGSSTLAGFVNFVDNLNPFASAFK